MNFISSRRFPGNNVHREKPDGGETYNGASVKVTQPDTSTRDEMSNGAGGHHGLQGMRERAATLDGEVEAGPEESGGFMVRLRLPFEPASEKTA